MWDNDVPEQVDTEGADNSAFEFEINDDMLKFLETSMKHKLELSKYATYRKVSFIL